MQTPEKGSEAMGALLTRPRKGIYIIRHSERLDEVDEIAYRAWVDAQSETSTRCDDKYCLSSDPPITERGRVIACEMADTVARFFPAQARVTESGGGGEGIEGKESDEKATQEGLSSSPLPVLYCSKMQRAVETAYPLALRLGVPLHVSSGLAQTAAAVEKRERSKRPFKFLSMAEISALAPGVEIIDYDEVEDAQEAALAAAVAAVAAPPPPSAASGGSALLTKEERRRAQEKLDKRWLRCIKDIMRNHMSEQEQVLIVAHRETTRSLLERTSGRRPERLPTPYCCIANFSIDEESLQRDHVGQSFSLDRFLTHEGKSIKWK